MFRLVPCSFLAALVALALAACSPDEPDVPRPTVQAQTSAKPDSGPGPALRVSVSPSTPGAPAAALPDFTRLIERAGPAVVNVTTTRTTAAIQGIPGAPGDPLYEFFRRFAPDAPEREFRRQGVGSGFIISADGYVLTNAHVVTGADEVVVRLADAAREYRAEVVGTDARTDIALLKVEASGLPVAPLGRAAELRPGEWVVAIGSPFGLDNTITAGVVSAVGRALPDESYVPFIQTDVAVNPGNSGGPLLNLDGEVVGINSMIYSRTGGYMGVSFAIPIEVALDVSDALREHGFVTRGRLGVRIQQVTQSLARSFGVDPPRGALVAAVEPASPAEKAGLKPGDVILSFAGTAIENVNDLPQAVAETRPGTEVKIDVWRSGERRIVAATVGELPRESEVAQAAGSGAEEAAANRLGLVLGEAPAALRRSLGIDYGLVIEAIDEGAADTELRRGDVIVALNSRSFASRAEFDRLLEKTESGETVAVLVRRGDASLYVPLEVA